MQEAKILPRNLKGNLQSFPLLDRHFIPKLPRDGNVIVGRLLLLLEILVKLVVVGEVVVLIVVVEVVVDVVVVVVVVVVVGITWLL